MKKINIMCLPMAEISENKNNSTNNLSSPYFSDGMRQINSRTKEAQEKFYVDELKERLYEELESSILKTKESPGYKKDREYYDFVVQCLEIWQYVLELYCRDLTSRQLYTLFFCIDSEVKYSLNSDDRRRIIVQRLVSMRDPLKYDVNDQFIKKIANSSSFEFNQLIELLQCSEVVKYCHFEKRDNQNYLLKVQQSSMSVFAHDDNDQKFVYTILSCPTNPDIIADDSSFVKEFSSELFISENGRSYFRTINQTMDDEIIKLSKKHPEDIFFTQNYPESLPENTCSSAEYFNGVRTEFKIQHGCQFLWISPIDVPDEKEYSDFKTQVVKFLIGKNSQNEKDTFKSDTSNAVPRDYYHVYSITLIWENDFFRWTATQNAYCYFCTSVEIKEQKPTNWWQRIPKNVEDSVALNTKDCPSTKQSYKKNNNQIKSKN